jgi:hypothetical protein
VIEPLPTDLLRKLTVFVAIMKTCGDMAKDIEWCMSGDTGESELSRDLESGFIKVLEICQDGLNETLRYGILMSIKQCLGRLDGVSRRTMTKLSDNVKHETDNAISVLGKTLDVLSNELPDHLKRYDIP